MTFRLELTNRADKQLDNCRESFPPTWANLRRRNGPRVDLFAEMQISGIIHILRRNDMTRASFRAVVASASLSDKLARVLPERGEASTPPGWLVYRVKIPCLPNMLFRDVKSRHQGNWIRSGEKLYHSMSGHRVITWH